MGEKANIEKDTAALEDINLKIDRKRKEIEQLESRKQALESRIFASILNQSSMDVREFIELISDLMPKKNEPQPQPA